MSSTISKQIIVVLLWDSHTYGMMSSGRYPRMKMEAPYTKGHSHARGVHTFSSEQRTASADMVCNLKAFLLKTKNSSNHMRRRFLPPSSV